MFDELIEVLGKVAIAQISQCIGRVPDLQQLARRREKNEERFK
ncbi:hypothetical protein [Nostoc sp. UIC 10630]|nr:hypothetical protein [Nostoc sp. UIC 10630]